MSLHLSSAQNSNMKSWSLGRKSSKKEKKESPESSPRPKSLIMNMPSSSSGAELSSSIQASPSLTYSTLPRSRQNSVEQEPGSSPTASKYLSTAQLKDKVRRLKTPSTTTTTNSSSRPPLTAKNNVQNSPNTSTNGDGKVRKTSLPSLIKSPVVASPSPSAPLLSPAAAVIGGRPSIDESDTNPFNDGISLDSTPTPPSPSPKERNSLKSLLATQSDHVCEDSSLVGKSNEVIVKSSKSSEITTKEEEGTLHPSALASLRRFKGMEGFGSLDKVKQTRFDSMTVKEDEEKELTNQKSFQDQQQQEYPFEIRKLKTTSFPKRQQKHQVLTKRKVEAKYDVAIETQRVLSWSFGQAKAGQVVVRQRRLVAMPIPSLLGCDRVASWTVERISRLTSCVIYVFGS